MVLAIMGHPKAKESPVGTVLMYSSESVDGHVFDMTDGWDGKPPGGVDHVVVVTHRPKP